MPTHLFRTDGDETKVKIILFQCLFWMASHVDPRYQYMDTEKVEEAEERVSALKIKVEEMLEELGSLKETGLIDDRSPLRASMTDEKLVEDDNGITPREREDTN